MRIELEGFEMRVQHWSNKVDDLGMSASIFDVGF